MKISTPSQIQMVDLKKQFLPLQDEIESGIKEVISSGAFINGPSVKSFAKNLENYLQVNHVIPCGNGTDALQIALMALGLQEGEEVITVPFTFVATAEVMALLKLKVIFVDIDPDTFNMDVEALKNAVSSNTKCIIPVHLFGQTADMEQICEIAGQFDIPIVEDNAQAIGADYFYKNGSQKKAGTLGAIGCTSFYPSKNLGAYGDAGALFTNNDELAEKIRCIANHGQKEKYLSDFIGINSRLDSFQAVVLNAKLKRLDEYADKRRRAAAHYDGVVANHPNFVIPFRAEYSSHVFHQYTLKYDGDRDALRARLSEAGVSSMVYYPYPILLHKAYEYLGYKNGHFPVSEKMGKSVISLPMHTELDEEQLNYICENVLAHP